MIRRTAPYALVLAAMLVVPAVAQAQETSTAGVGTAAFITKADPGQYKASQLVGVKIYNSTDENIGNVNELLLDKKGSIAGVIIGVGGFLGIGEKNVAVPYSAVSWVDTPPAPAIQPDAGTSAPGAAPPTQTMTPAPAAPPVNRVQDYPYRGMLAMTKEQLEAAPAFKFASEVATQ